MIDDTDRIISFAEQAADLADGLYQARQMVASVTRQRDTLEAKWKASTDSLEVYSADAAKFLARAEATEAEVAHLREQVDALRAACNNVAINMERTSIWSDWHTQVSISILRNALNATQ